MPTRTALITLLLSTAACATLRGPPPVAPLGDRAEVHVYLLPLPRDADRLSFSVQGVWLRRPDGSELPLEVAQREVSGTEGRAQRLLASGRVQPGTYAGLAVLFASAAVGEGPDRARLLVSAEPVRAELEIAAGPGRAAVVWLRLEPAAVQGDFSFAPRVAARLPPQIPPQAALYTTSARGAAVVTADRSERLVTAVLPVAGTPRGIALDLGARHAYVALHREDRIEVLDVAGGVSAGSIKLSPGDGPGDVALAFDGTLVVVNERSRSVSFLDPVSMMELSRVGVGDDPTGLLLDRSRRRAYVANRGSASVTVIDLANRAVAATVPTDPEPIRMQLSSDGSRLHVIHRGSAHVASYAAPSLAPLARVYVGLGAAALRVDPRTDLVYLARTGEARVAVLDPIALQPVDLIALPAPASQLTIDDVENALLAVLPGRRALAVVDLASRRVLAEIPVGPEPYAVALGRERL